MSRQSDIEAGRSYVSISAQTDKLSQALNKADRMLSSFGERTKSKMAVIGKGIGSSFARSVIGLSVALGAARKAFDVFGKAAVSAMDKLRSSGTDAQKDAIAALDGAIGRVTARFNELAERTVEGLSGPVTKAIDTVQRGWLTLLSIIDEVKSKFSGVFSTIESWYGRLGDAWDKFARKQIEKYPQLAKIAADSLRQINQDAMKGWQDDNRLLDELDTINSKVNKTSEDIKRENAIVSQLKSRWGDVGLEVDQVSGKVSGLADAQKKVLELQNRARISQLEAEKQAVQAQQRALQAENRRTLSNANPGVMSVLGSWAKNTVQAPFSSAVSYRSMVDIAGEQNDRNWSEARAKVAESEQQAKAFQAQIEALDAGIEAIQAGQNWYEQAGMEARTRTEKTPVGTNQRAGSMVDRYAGMSQTQADIARLEDQYAKLIKDRVEELRSHGYSAEEAENIAQQEHAADREYTQAQISRLKAEARAREDEILQGGADIVAEMNDLNKSELQRALEHIENRYIEARSQMIDSLIALGHSQEEATELSDKHMQEVRKATDRLKQETIRKDREEKMAKQQEEMRKEQEMMKKNEIAQARAWANQMEREMDIAERRFGGSSSGTFSAFEQIGAYNPLQESVRIEKQQLEEQKELLNKFREFLDMWEQQDTSAVFA